MSFRFKGLPLDEKGQEVCDFIEENDRVRFRKPYAQFYPYFSTYPQGYSFHRDGVPTGTPVDNI